MSLPLKAIDRLFDRMSATYGAAWDRSLGTSPVSDVKTVWAYELGGFAGKLEMMAWALENLPEDPPNVIKFRALCRRAPAPAVPMLPEPKADPARVAAELAKLAPLLGSKREQKTPVDHKAWARRILDKVAAGYMVTPIAERFAREALRDA